MIANSPKTTSRLLLLLQTHPLIPNRLGYPVGGPEKAGVGGSIRVWPPHSRRLTVDQSFTGLAQRTDSVHPHPMCVFSCSSSFHISRAVLLVFAMRALPSFA
jgi:hypothetical protein